MLATQPPAPWPAPAATRPVRATVTVPGSKSITNRALVLAALADGPTRIEGALLARDTELAMTALRQLGCGLRVSGTTVEVEPLPIAEQPRAPLSTGVRAETTVDCGLAGTVMRFLPPVAALTSLQVHLDGDPRARQRPLAPLTQALRHLGVAIDADCLPLTISGAGVVTGGPVTLDSSASSQFISALLLAAPRFRCGVLVTHHGPALPSLPHVRLTVDMLRDRGVTVTAEDADPTHCSWLAAPGPIAGGDIRVAPDLSNAGPFLAAAMVTGGRVSVPDWPAQTWQAGDALREIFTEMGGEVRLDTSGLTLTGPAQPRGIDRDFSDVGELVPTVAAVAAVAATPSRLRRIGHLRGHETDRLAALVRELRALGCGAQELDDDIMITPRPLHPATVECYADHRMATFAAIIGLRVPGISLSDVACTAKTLPDFPRLWTDMVIGS